MEIRHPNGQLAHTLEVKKGKADGAWREFFDDGSVRQVCFYKAGEPCGDYWPTGQVKHKASKRGAEKVLEWFYPSGKLQKRLVLKKDGTHAEPVRLYHENGQLAEEMTLRGGDKRGPWLRFFEDGSPKLRAEAAEHGREIIHDAWDAPGHQVVKDGTGVFDDNGWRISPTYSVHFKSDSRRVTELAKGIPNGKCTTYNDGVLWSVGHYVDGVAEGDLTLYWENGHVRNVSRLQKGKEVESRDFPKFDQPVPAVVLTLEANQDLYSAWQHIPVDEFPAVQNLDEVRALLKVPAFLQEVYERNKAGELKSDYEDWNTFNDGIAYFLTVDERGQVVEVTANGSGVSSGGDWGTYPQVLRRLRFTPGRIRGRAIGCRVLARVNHTFVEGAKY